MASPKPPAPVRPPVGQSPARSEAPATGIGLLVIAILATGGLLVQSIFQTYWESGYYDIEPTYTAIITCALALEMMFLVAAVVRRRRRRAR